MIRRPLGALALSVLAALVVSCDVGADCEPLDCNDGVFITATPADEWSAGDYELTLTVDGDSRTCAFSVPKFAPTPAVTVFLDCGEDVIVSLFSLTECGSGSCSADNHFELRVKTDGAPEKVGVKITRDSEVLLDDDTSVEYEDLYPRGPECGGGCRQSHYDLVVDP